MIEETELFRLHIQATSLALSIQKLLDKTDNDTRLERIMNKAYKRAQRRYVKIMRIKKGQRYA